MLAFDFVEEQRGLLEAAGLKVHNRLTIDFVDGLFAIRELLVAAPREDGGREHQDGDDNKTL